MSRYRMGDIFGMIKFQIYLGCSVDAGLEPTYEETIRVTPPPPPRRKKAFESQGLVANQEDRLFEMDHTQWRSQLIAEKSNVHQRETSGSSNDSLHLRPFSNWELLLKERILSLYGNFS